MTYSPFRHAGSVLWKRNPVHLTFFVTRQCNSRCSYCFYLSDKNVIQSTAPELSLNEIEKIASSVGRLLWLAFSGGEVFLRDDIDEITQLFYDINKPSIILFSTNGLLTDVIRSKIESILTKCKKSTIVVKLSLDGTQQLHDSLRGKGSFTKTLMTYDALVDLLDRHTNFELGVNTVYSSANEDYMMEILDYVRTLDKITTHTVSMIRGEVADKNLKKVDYEKYRETIDRLASNLQKNVSGIYRFQGAKIKAAQDVVQRDIIYDTIVQQRRIVPCYAGRLNLVLRETGDVYPCESFTKRLGNVRESEYNVKKLCATDRAVNIIKGIDQQQCFCTHECYTMTNIFFNLRLYPALAREYVRL